MLIKVNRELNMLGIIIDFIRHITPLYFFFIEKYIKSLHGTSGENLYRSIFEKDTIEV